MNDENFTKKEDNDNPLFEMFEMAAGIVILPPLVAVCLAYTGVSAAYKRLTKGKDDSLHLDM